MDEHDLCAEHAERSSLGIKAQQVRLPLKPVEGGFMMGPFGVRYVKGVPLKPGQGGFMMGPFGVLYVRGGGQADG